MNGKYLSVFSLVALLGGCSAQMTEAECRSTDWYQLGFRDARNYGIQPQIGSLATQCSQVGVRAGETPYMEGWREGYAEAQRGAGGGGGGGY
ncbi:MAG TPA: hypothetical protein VF943_07030 [Burkholderiales bacterium]